MSLSNVLARLDQELSSLVGQWNAYSTGIATALVLILTYAFINRVEPETHPMLLARQSQGSPVRREGESPVYRGHSAPHGLPLNSGLNIKEPGASKWAPGRNGDLRDVWRRAVSGPPDGEGTKGTGRIFTVLGSEKVIEHKLGMLSVRRRRLHCCGKHTVLS